MAGVKKMTETMQRWTMSALGRESLTLIQEPILQPGPGEVRVRVNAVALNYRDKMVIEGTMPIPLSFPFTLASDMAGVVDSIGEGVTRFQPGARVIQPSFRSGFDGKPQADARNLPYKTSGGYFQGMLAEYVIVKEDALAASPETLDDAEAGAPTLRGAYRLVRTGGTRSAARRAIGAGTGNGRRGDFRPAKSQKRTAQRGHCYVRERWCWRWPKAGGQPGHQPPERRLG